MRMKVCRFRALLILALAAFFLLSVLCAGCGDGGTEVTEGGGSSYEKAVLDAWARLESVSENLVDAANQIEDRGEYPDFTSLLADGRERIASFEEKVGSLKVPEKYRDSQEALEAFLSAYDAYLRANQDEISIVLAGDDGSGLPTIEPKLEAAQRKLEDYRDSQEYNPAALNRHVWDITHILDESMTFPPDNPNGGDNAAAREIPVTWYTLFNQGDSQSMSALLDSASPSLAATRSQFFAAQVGEAYGSGLRAACNVDSVAGYTSAGEERAKANCTVGYSATEDMEGNPVAPHSEKVEFDLVKRAGGWYIYDILSEGSPALY